MTHDTKRIEFALVAGMTMDRHQYHKARADNLDAMLTCPDAAAIWRHFEADGKWDLLTFQRSHPTLLPKVLADRDNVILHDYNYDKWVDIIRNEHHKRLLSAAIAKASTQEPMDALSTMDRLRDAMMGNAGEPDHGSEVQRGLAEIDAICRGEQPKGLMSWGWQNFDREFGLIAQHELIVIGARPGVGKSALLMQVALGMRDQGKPISIYSLEMRTSELLQRMAAIRTNIGKWQCGPMHDARNNSYRKAYLDLGNDTGIRWHTATQSLDAILASAAFDSKAHGIKAVFIDYLQLIEVPRSAKRLEALSDITRKLKLFASLNNVPVITAAQLNRGGEQDGRGPKLSDLRESGTIEQDADRVLLLHRDENKGIDRIYQAKNRAGRTATVDVHFNKQATRYEAPMQAAEPARTEQPKQRGYSDYDTGY